MIEFDDISFTLGHRRVISHFSAHIAKGQHVALTGESGAGKSTLMNSIIGLTLPTQGIVRVDGLDVNPQNIRTIRTLTAWVPQDTNLPYDTVAQLIEAPFTFKANKGLRLNRSRVDALFEALGLNPAIYDQSMRSISGGERQRVMIASALLLDKPILLLDEPSSALDGPTRQNMYRLFAGLTDTTIVAITHDDELAASFDRTITLKKL